MITDAALIKLRIFLDNGQDVDAVSKAFDGVSLSSSWNHVVNSEGYILDILLPGEHKKHIFSYLMLAESSLKVSLNNYTISSVENKNWLKENQKSFKPFTVGHFYIYGSHIKNPNPQTFIPLQIDAATAFGSGNHGSTEGCLLALESLQTNPYSKILDLGCGSGILGIAASKLWKEAQIMASDYDEECVRVSSKNAYTNNSPQVKVIHSAGFQSHELAKQAPYNLIIANILASVLEDLADAIIENITSNGHLVLSGILNTQSKSIIKHYTSLGLYLEQEICIEEWTTLILKK